VTQRHSFAKVQLKLFLQTGKKNGINGEHSCCALAERPNLQVHHHISQTLELRAAAALHALTCSTQLQSRV
jgi:hypothetical protein